jgi:hypothetical protein
VVQEIEGRRQVVATWLAARSEPRLPPGPVAQVARLTPLVQTSPGLAGIAFGEQATPFGHGKGGSPFPQHNRKPVGNLPRLKVRAVRRCRMGGLASLPRESLGLVLGQVRPFRRTHERLRGTRTERCSLFGRS